MIQELKLQGFKNFRDATLPLGDLTLLVGTNASGKSNLRDAFRFLHGVSRGYTLAEIIGEKWIEGGVLQWKGIRGGTREAGYCGHARVLTDRLFCPRMPRTVPLRDCGRFGRKRPGPQGNPGVIVFFGRTGP